MVATNAAESTKETAFPAKTEPDPIEETSNPPSRGPTRMPALRPRLSIPFAQLRSWSPTRLGMAAEDEEKNGASATAERKANRSNSHGAWTRAMARKQPAPARPEAIMT